MGRIIPGLIDGFSRRNMDRIYHGKPALIGGKLPKNSLPQREFEALGHIAAGLTYEQTAQAMNIKLATIRSHTNKGYRRLGILSKTQLAGYFPLEPQDGVMQGKRLADITPGGLDILQLLSEGLHCKRVADIRNSTASTVRTHIHHVKDVWEGANGALRPALIANGIRSRYVQAIELGMVAVKMEEIGEPTLPALAVAEPSILRDLDEFAQTQTASG